MRIEDSRHEDQRPIFIIEPEFDNEIRLIRNLPKSLHSQKSPSHQEYHLTSKTDAGERFSVTLADNEMQELFMAYMHMKTEYETGAVVPLPDYLKE
jgi:hypothetical protein